MPFDGTPITSDPIETVLQALEQRDAVAAASAFAPDGRLVDPQFPASEYRGRERVRAALEWSLTNLAAQPGFEIRLFLEVAGTCELEVESRRAGGAVRPFAEGVRRRARGRRNLALADRPLPHARRGVPDRRRADTMTMTPGIADTDRAIDESTAECRRLWRRPPREGAFFGDPTSSGSVHETDDGPSWAGWEVEP